MLFEAEEVNLFLLAIPVTPDALKDSRAVVQAMSHDAYLGFGQRYELVVKKSI